MKLYRAIFSHNNGDTCEWERWYDKASVWYNSKELAQKHLNELNAYKHYLLDDFMKWSQERGTFKYRGPRIEEINISTEFVPFELEHNEEHVWSNFNGKRYINKF